MPFVIGLTDREREMHSAAFERLAETLAQVARDLRDPEKDAEMLVQLMIFSLQGDRIQDLLKAVSAAVGGMEIPDTPGGELDV